MNTQQPEAQLALEERYERLPIEFIAPSKTNPRTHFDDAYLAELANSIGEKGLIQPILVRPHDSPRNGTQFEIVAGECRYRASMLAGKTHVPAIIRAYSNDQVLELQLIENIHRKDLTALEQAVGYRALIKSNPDKHSAATIAQRIGMSEAWVWDRLKLNDLIPEAKKILDDEKMSVGHAILIARLKPEDQKRTIAFDDESSSQYRGVGLWRNDGGFDWEEAEESGKKRGKYDELKPCSVRELEAWIRDHIRFDVQHAAKAQPLTFEQTATRVSEAAAQPGRSKKLISITHEYRVADDARDEDGERTYGSQSWERADGKDKSKTCEHSVLGVVVAGRGQGETLQVCVAREKCEVHFGAVIRQKKKNAKLRESGKGTQAAKNESKAAAREQAKQEEAERRRQAWEALQPHVVADAIDQIKSVETLTAKQAVAIEEADVYDNLRHSLHEQLGKQWFKNPAAAWLSLAVAGRDNFDSFEEYVADVAKPLGLNIKRLEAIRDKAFAAEPAPAKKAKAS